ncbi:AP-3 complex subunit mu-2 [Irineochytrium annulatum]|nr:AP-3 complex subunit mu-2 [Irineochytrium annulatum]
MHMADLFVSYFGGLSELILKDNFAIVYELLEELLDYGQPYITEPNILKDMIPPPSLYSSVMNAVSIGTSFGTKTPTGALSQVPWRTAGIKYNQNEIFFDVNETIDVTVDRYGSIVTGNIHGEIICGSKLSGMPELTLGFSNSRLFEDAMVSFHPCVRQLRFDRDRVLSFIPPDGDFKVMSYTLSLNNLAHAQNLPVVIKPSLQLTKSGGRLTVTLQPRSTGGKPIEAITISLTLPAYVSSAKLNASAGSIQFDQIGKVLKWTIPKLNPDAALPQLSGTLYLESGFNPSDQPPPLIGVKFDGKVNMFTASGLRIDALQVLNEPYKPYKIVD